MRNTRSALLTLGIILLAGCSISSLEPYSRVPISCTAIDEEMQANASEIDAIMTARIAKEAGIVIAAIGVAAAAFPPAVAIIAPLLGSIQMDTRPMRDRIRHLANAKLHRGCE